MNPNRLRIACCLAMAIAALLPAAVIAWTPVAPGIDYQEFNLPDPNNVFVARMDRHNPNCFLDTSLANGRIDGSIQTIGNQFNLYDGAMSYWGQDWGGQTDVVVAVNGDYWNTGTYIPLGPQVQSGWVIKTQGGTTLSWLADRRALMGTGPWTSKRVRYATGASQPVDDINVARGADKLILYTNHYGANTKTDGSGTEVLVEMMRPAVVARAPDAPVGIVRQVRVNQGSTPVPFDHVVLSASGTAAATLQQNATLGSTIAIYHTSTATYADWSGAYSGSGGLDLLQTVVPAGTPPLEPTGGVVAPRTAIAFNRDYVYFVVVDGRSAQSIGMDFNEVSDFCRLTLGATTGLSCDGGGSSTIVVNGSLKNKPSDGSQRAVPNGVLMCILQPKQQTATFRSGDRVRTTGTANLRHGPGTNYLSLTTVGNNTQGTVVDHSLRGVRAKGYNWWKCEFPGATGWVAESLLTLVAHGDLPYFTQQPAERRVCRGEPTTFAVTAGGTGTLSYQWQRHGIDLTEGAAFAGVNTPTLTVLDPGDSTAGSFRCIVTDDVGQATSYSAALTLRFATTFHQQPQAIEFYPLSYPGDATFSVGAGGEGETAFQWQKDGQDLADDGHVLGATTPTLTVHNVDSRDAGRYRCRVSAGCGETYSSEATLTVYSSDFDGDGDADLDDFAHLQACMGIQEVKQTNPACADTDLDRDRHVERDDLVLFLRCVGGPDVPLPPGC